MRILILSVTLQSQLVLVNYWPSLVTSELEKYEPFRIDKINQCFIYNRYKIAMRIDLFTKSSLLNAILGELEPSEGSCKVVGKVAYASQTPWIFSGTVQQNILCGLDYDAERYNRVIEACALIDDFNLFSDGDSTLMVNEALHSVAVKRHASIWLVLCTLTLTFIYSTIL